MSVIDSVLPQAAADSVCDNNNNASPFEGPEKLLEIWFGPTPDSLPQRDHPSGKRGLRTVEKAVWEDMLAIVKCKVLNFVQGVELDAYLLSESSMFIFPHKLILKTCGTTLNLLGLPRILDIAATHCGLTAVHRFFYSRKSFMFPERQQGPHKDWRAEVDFLDSIFDVQRGAAYTVGKVNGDHWLLYLTNPVEEDHDTRLHPVLNGHSNGHAVGACPPKRLEEDYTLEILMTKLSSKACAAFEFPTPDGEPEKDPQGLAQRVSQDIGITSLFPTSMTTLDAFAFTPCGYSSNALIRPSKDAKQDGYYTIHVTPEHGWSFASFECNVPLSHYPTGTPSAKTLPDLQTLIQRVVQIFQPGHLSLTLFVTSSTVGEQNDDGTSDTIEAPVDSAHRAFKDALTPKGYRRTDKINYEFGGYDLAFASFEAQPRAE